MSDKNIDWLKRLQILDKALEENGVRTNFCVDAFGKIGYRLDFSKHDKRFKDEIASLKRQIEKLDSIRMRCHESARDSFDNGNYGILHIVTADELKNEDKVKELQCELDKTHNQLMEVEKEAQEHIAELESELEVKDNLLKIKNGLCKNELPTEITIDGYKCEIIQTEQGLYISRDRIYEIIDKEKKVLKDKCTELEDRHKEDCDKINQLKHELSKKVDFETDRLVKLPFDPLETANMLINATYKAEIPFLERQVDRDLYDIDDLEQIAEHLLVYCKHHGEEQD